VRLLLIRHGQTASNVLGLLDTAPPGPGLTDLGVQQAAALPATLADQRVDLIAASTQTRARLTAAPLATERGLEVLVRAGLCEVPAGDLEMRGDRDAVRGYLATVREWMGGNLELAMPGGSTGAQVLARFDAVVDEVTGVLGDGVGDEGTAVLFAHGAVLRTWATARGTDDMLRQDLLERFQPLHNTGMIVVNRTDDGWRIESWAGRALGGPRLDDGAEDGPAGGDPTGSAFPVGSGSG
jgi:probable phosphoglycerate mutase